VTPPNETESVHVRWQALHTVQDVDTSAELAVYRDNDHNAIAVVFRGTESFTDVYYDAKFFSSPCRLYVPDCNNAGSIPDGFGVQYSSLRNELLSFLIAGQYHRAPHVVVTGHSLGGALAFLHTVDLISSQQNVSSIVTYTFGQPRASGHFLASAVDEAVVNGTVDSFIRYVNFDSDQVWDFKCPSIV
jgi:predicted lipase